MKALGHGTSATPTATETSPLPKTVRLNVPPTVNRALCLLICAWLAFSGRCPAQTRPPATPQSPIPGLSEVDSGIPSPPATPRAKSVKSPTLSIPGINPSSPPPNLPVLTSSAQIQQLTAEQAAQGYAVKLQGVITMNAAGTSQTFLQDETGGVYLSQAIFSPLQKNLLPGHRVEVRGKTFRGRFSTSVQLLADDPGSIRYLGKGSLPDPLLVTGDSVTDPRNEAQWSEILGVVRRIKPRVYFGKTWAAITFSSGNTRSEALCFLPNGPLNAPLVGAEVRMRGVPSLLLSERGQIAGRYLLVSSPEEITLLRPAEQNSFEVPELQIRELPKLEIGQTTSPRVHLRGIVTFILPDRGFYIADGTGYLAVHNADRIPKIGEEVDVLGFAEWGDWSLQLQDASVRSTGRQSPPIADLLDASELSTGKFDGALVETDATLLHIARPASGPLLVLQSEGRLFEARFANPPSMEELRKLPELSRLRMRGLLIHQRPPNWRDSLDEGSSNDPSQAVPFEIWLHSSSDLRILTKPAWWNKTRITIALCALGMLGTASAAWILTLRSQVTLLTEINSAQRVREATFEERTRVARELHDSVEQELAGLTIQLDAVRARLHSDPQSATAAVDTARAMLRHTREEARRSIWDLRSMVLERGSLASAMEEIAKDPGIQGPAQISVHVSGKPVRLSGKAELNLVRICQEAASNARKYAKASAIQIRLDYSSSHLSLCIEDDGEGFDPGSMEAVRLGHFGLLHMRERAEQIDADFVIQSAPGKGTAIKTRLAIAPHATAPIASTIPLET